MQRAKLLYRSSKTCIWNTNTATCRHLMANRPSAYERAHPNKESTAWTNLSFSQTSHYWETVCSSSKRLIFFRNFFPWWLSSLETIKLRVNFIDNVLWKFFFSRKPIISYSVDIRESHWHVIGARDILRSEGDCWWG